MHRARSLLALSPLLLGTPASGQAPTAGVDAPQTPLVRDAGVWRPLGEPSAGGRVTGIAVSPFDNRRVLMSGDMLGVGLSLDGGASWGSTHGFVSWEVGDITWHPTDPRRVWVGTMGGPYLSVDGGLTWSLRRAGMPPQLNWNYSAPIEKVLFDPNDSTRLIAAGGSSRRWNVDDVDGDFGAVWESLDEGASWTKISTLTATGYSSDPDADGVCIVGMSFAAGSSLILYATADERGFYRSDDGGATWTKPAVNLPHDEVERVYGHPLEEQTAFLSLGNDGFDPGGVYRSLDGGATWDGLNADLPQVVGPAVGNTSRYKGFDVGPLGQQLFAVDDRFGTDGMFLSFDGGASWSTTLASGTLDLPYTSGVEMEVAEVSLGDPNVLLAAGSDNVVRSLDGGATWHDAANVHLGPGVFRGRGFSGLVAEEVTFNPWNPEHILVQGLDGARLQQTLDGGQSWTFEGNDTGSFGGGSDAVFASATRAYAALGAQGVFYGVARTVDGGLSWDVVAGGGSGLPEVGAGGSAGAIHASRLDPDRVWVVVGGDVYRSTDGGATWGVVQAGFGPGWFAASQDESVLYLTGETQCYASTDGVSFTGIGGPARPGKVAMGPDDTLWLAAHDRTGNPGLGVWTYTPATGWEAVLDPGVLAGDWKQAVQYMVAVTVSASNPDLVAVSTADPPFRDVSRATGVYLSEDRGQTWRSINAGLPLLRGEALAFDPSDDRRLILGTSGRGFFAFRRF
ncbi:MAG: hypothetical protein AAF682_07950 [Planctomycetota bacterium]